MATDSIQHKRILFHVFRLLPGSSVEISGIKANTVRRCYAIAHHNGRAHNREVYLHIVAATIFQEYGRQPGTKRGLTRFASPPAKPGAPGRARVAGIN